MLGQVEVDARAGPARAQVSGDAGNRAHHAGDERGHRAAVAQEGRATDLAQLDHPTAERRGLEFRFGGVIFVGSAGTEFAQRDANEAGVESGRSVFGAHHRRLFGAVFDQNISMREQSRENLAPVGSRRIECQATFAAGSIEENAAAVGAADIVEERRLPSHADAGLGRLDEDYVGTRRGHHLAAHRAGQTVGQFEYADSFKECRHRFSPFRTAPLSPHLGWTGQKKGPESP